MIWLGEEIHKVECEQNILFVENGDFISKGFELIPNLFSKTSGIVTIVPKNNNIQIISPCCESSYVVSICLNQRNR